MSAAPLPLRLWLLAGALVTVLVPEARGHHLLVGWLPYWLLVAPLVSLAAWRVLRHAPQPRRRPLRRRPARQARRIHRARWLQAA
jgi:hypothetical protein